MKNSILLLLTIFLSASSFSQDKQNIDLIGGIGIGGVLSGKTIPLSSTYSFGILKNEYGFVSTISYGTYVTNDKVRSLGFSIKFIMPIHNQTFIGIGPDIHISFLGLTDINLSFSLNFAITDDGFISVGWSDYDQFSLGFLIRF